MNEKEWEALSGYVEDWWPGEFSDTKARNWFDLLRAYPAGVVAAALKRLAEKGERYRPAASEVLGEMRRLTEPSVSFMTWDQAWPLIAQAIDRVRVSINHPDFDEQEQAAIDWLAEQDQVVAAYAARRGLCGRAGSLGHEPVYGEFGGAVQHRLAEDYGDAVTVAKERVAAGLPSVPERALLLAHGAGKGGLSGGLAAVVEHARPAPKLEAGEA